MSALSLEAGATAKGKTDSRAAKLRGTYWTKIILGCLIASIGVMLMLSPLHYAEVFVSVILPLAVVGLGLFLAYQALRQRKEGKSGLRTAIGILIVVLGLSMFYFWESVALIILLILAAWFLGSAVLSIKSALAQGGLSHEGVIPKLVFGLLSLNPGHNHILRAQCGGWHLVLLVRGHRPGGWHPVDPQRQCPEEGLEGAGSGGQDWRARLSLDGSNPTKARLLDGFVL